MLERRTGKAPLWLCLCLALCALVVPAVADAACAAVEEACSVVNSPPPPPLGACLTDGTNWTYNAFTECCSGYPWGPYCACVPDGGTVQLDAIECCTRYVTPATSTCATPPPTPSPPPPSPAPPPPSPDLCTGTQELLSVFPGDLYGGSNDGTQLQGMSADSQGNLYFGSRNTGTNGAAVMKLTPGGELGVWKDGFENYIAGVVVDVADSDNIWVILEQADDSIIKLAINGTVLLTASTTATARRSASRAAADGSIWVAQATYPTTNVQILKISRAGVVTPIVSGAEWDSAGLTGATPYGMDVDLFNSVIYVGAGADSQLYRWPSAGGPEDRFDAPTHGPDTVMTAWYQVCVNPANSEVYAQQAWQDNNYSPARALAGLYKYGYDSNSPTLFSETSTNALYCTIYNDYIYAGKTRLPVSANTTLEPELFFYDLYGGALGLAVQGDTFYTSSATQGALVQAAPASFDTPSGYATSALLAGLDNPGDICGIWGGKLWLLTGTGSTGTVRNACTKLTTVNLANLEVEDVVTGLTGALACAFDAKGSGDVYIGDDNLMYRLPAATALPTTLSSLIYVAGTAGGQPLLSVAGYYDNSSSYAYWFVASAYTLEPSGNQQFGFNVVRNKPFPTGYTNVMTNQLWEYGNAINVARTAENGTVEGYFRGPSMALDAAHDVLYLTYNTAGLGSGPILKLPSASTRGGGIDGGEQLFNTLDSFPGRLLVKNDKLFALGYSNIFKTTCPLDSGVAR